MEHPLKQITPLILTYNEESNIGRSLESLSWAQKIIIIDSFSTDSTLEIAGKTKQAIVFQRHFDSFADQCNFGLGLIQTPWCLSLDADHIVTPSFLEELGRFMASMPNDVVAVRTPFRYLVHGKALRGTLLPPRFNLIRPGYGFYQNDGHSHHFIPRGEVRSMRQPLSHDDRKPLNRWLASQQVYIRQETIKLLSTPKEQLSPADRLRLLHVIAPFAVLAICLIWHRGLLDGWRGWFYAFQRMYAETLLSLMVWEARQNGDDLRPRAVAELPEGPETA